MRVPVVYVRALCVRALVCERALVCGRVRPAAADAHPSPRLVLQVHEKWVWDCTWSADSSYLVTASSDCSARLWEVNRGVVIRHYTGHHKAVVACALNDSTDRI